MKDNNFYSCSDMIMQTFTNIEKSTFDKNTKLIQVWKKILQKVSYCGEKLIEHSQIVEVKNNILLIETDHPGWIQMFQMNSKFILNGLKMYAPELKISSLAYRLKGSNALLAEVDYEKAFKSESSKENRKIEKEEKILQQYEKRNENSAETGTNQDLPEELLLKFKSIKESMLTKNKN